MYMKWWDIGFGDQFVRLAGSDKRVKAILWYFWCKIYQRWI